jgi:glycosyltransferase involved in cell wall biosynthesis
VTLTVSVDGRALEKGHGIGRYAEGLLGALTAVADERGGRLVTTGRRLLRPHAQVHHSLSLYEVPIARRARLVVTMHDAVPLRWPSEYLRTGIRHKALYRALRRAAAIVCPSTSAREQLLEHVELDRAAVTVVPEATHERFRPTGAAGVRERLGLKGRYLLFVGSLADPRKDVEGLVEAFDEWSRAGDREEILVLAGPGRPAARDLERRGRVLVAGFVSEDDLPALYSGASGFVTASRYEGFGLSALESLACGTPVVGYDVGAMRETAGPGGLLVPEGDRSELIRAAGRLCDEPALAERLAAEGRRHAAGFSWRRTAELTWDVYERVA